MSTPSTMPDPGTTAGYQQAADGAPAIAGAHPAVAHPAAHPAVPYAPPSWPDTAVLTQLANALFQPPRHQPLSSPASPGIPAVPPSPTVMPALSVVTTAAPLAPANPPMGAPDVPTTTIPSYVPTPNITAPSSPPVLQPSAASFGYSDVPQPGASPGSFGPAAPPADPGAFPGRLDFSALHAPPSPNVPPFSGGSFTVPGGVALQPSDALYFLGESNSFARPAPDAISAPLDFRSLSHDLRPRTVPALATEPRPFDPHAVRRDFPLLQEQVRGKPLIWLDNAATTQKPQAVIDRLAYFYAHENSNVHRGAHVLAARATDAYEAAREKVRRFIGASSAKDIIFVRGTTEAINLVAQAWGRRNVGADDEIVITWLEHHANIVPWQQLCAQTGARLRVAPVDDSGQVLLDEYEKLLGPRTRIVAFSQVSNALGTVTPAREMIEMAHRHGARVLLDGAQSVSHMRVDVAALDCDFFVFSGHKIFGPTGIGVVYGKPDVLEAMPPWQGGGNMISDATFEKTTYQGPPERFEAGTGNIADAVGLGAALDYVDAIGIETIGRYEHGLLVYATEKMLGVPGLKLIGTAKEKASVLSFVLDECRTEDVGQALDREGIAVRAGHHCAQPILRRYGLESTVRPSLAFYNTFEDVDALVAALHRIQSGRSHRTR
jgi:cysteine desulfurase / selenocysteine lyase